MGYKNKLGLIATFVLLVAIGGYFSAAHFGIFSKRQAVYDNGQEVSVSELAQEAQSDEVNSQQSVDDSMEQQQAVEEQKTEDKKVEDKVIGTQPEVADKPTEKNIDTPKIEDEKASAGKIVDKLISWGFTKSSGRKIDTIIVHSSYDALGDDPYSVDGIISEYKQYNVGAHYLIARDGVIYRLVEDKNIAWHAGVSKVPDGRTNVNDFSIGIEMINTKDGKYTSQQYDALNSLIASLKKKYEIKYILGHNEIAPGRKTDPWGIDWDKVKR